VYCVVLLVTLLFFGRLSDHVGRRPVIMAGLATAALASALFLLAHSIALLFAARVLQGVAVGLTTVAAGAALLELRPARALAALLSRRGHAGGRAPGPLGGGVLAQSGPAPPHLVWWLVLVASAAAIAAVWRMPEPGTPRPGARASLRPRISVPSPVRGAFAAA